MRARACLRRWLVDGHLASPRDEAEARDLAAAASEQGLCGLLHADIVSRGLLWPPAQVDSLRETQRWLLVRGVRQLDAAARVSRLLRDRGLRSLPLKGASLVETLYDSVADRAMADVDILALDDWQASMRALREAGFRDSGAADHARCFEDPVTGTLVELHHSITSCPGLFPVDAEGLWARSVEGKGQIVRRPSVEDLLVHLALHAAFQHGLVLSLVQYLDFRRLFERTPPDHERLLAIAQASGALGALAAAVAAATAVVGLDPPAVLADALSPRVPRGLRRALEGLRRNPLLLVAPSAPSLVRVRWALADRRRLTLLAGTLGPREPGVPRRLHHAFIRAGTLAWRWGPLMNRA